VEVRSVAQLVLGVEELVGVQLAVLQLALARGWILEHWAPMQVRTMGGPGGGTDLSGGVIGGVRSPRKAEGVAGSAKGNGVGSGISSGGTGRVGTRSYVPGRRVGSAGSRYAGSGMIRGVSPRGAGSVRSGSGTSGANPGGGAS
jgi:hypothetical protein